MTERTVTGSRSLRLERTLSRIRWVGVALGLFQVVFYVPRPGVTVADHATIWGTVLMLSLAAGNLLLVAALRRGPSEAALARMGMAAFAADLIALFGITWIWSFEQFGATWIIIPLGALEGAARYGLAGAMAPVAAAAVLEPLRDLYRLHAYGFPFIFSDWTFRVGITGVLALFAGTTARSLARERDKAERRAEVLTDLRGTLEHQLKALRAAEEESNRRAGLLATVASSARSMSALETEQVLASVVTACQSLGFESAEICVFDPPGDTYRVLYARGLPQTYVGRTHPANQGLAGEVLRLRRTVVVSDYSNLDSGVRELQRAGYRAALATPVWSQGSLDAILSAGTRAGRAIASEEIEAFELLASQAGRALENARLYEEERRTVERLEELDGMKQEFVDMVSHEIRTPLTAIQGMGLTLADRWDELDDAIRRELLGRLNANADVLHELITTLLDFSRLENGPIAVQSEPVPLAETTRQMASRLSHLLARHPLDIDIDDDLWVRTDPLLLQRVVENLLSNAAKHTPDGTPVRISASAEGDGARFEVADEGPGIPPGDLRHLGERFFRGGELNERRSRGTGLGLALVRKILQLQDSELAVESEVGRGARFSFRLPLAQGPATTEDRTSLGSA